MRSAGLHVTIGEAMVVLFPDGHRPLATAGTFSSDVGGAEFNVATGLARLGVPTAWVSRLGDDGFGERIRAVAEEARVDASAVELDSARPTGLYVKETTAGVEGPRTRMHYYRRGSAAAALSADTLASPQIAALLRSAELVHTSGITAALSPSSADAVAGLRDVVGPDTRVSVDLNYRPQLWAEQSTDALDALVDQADLLFVGRDEAESHFGHADAAQLFARNPRLDAVVIKDDVRRASLYRRDGGEAHVPCLSVEVVEPVGAGDAFAAGFLCGLAEGRDDVACLRIGHAVAALTLIGRADRPATVVDAPERDRIQAADDAEWSGWCVGPGSVPWRVAS
jgi:2-dehydro-3-deoxygluconokinase